MELCIQGHPFTVLPGESLGHVIGRLGLDAPALSERPLAARLAGETLQLHFVPLESAEGTPRPAPILEQALAAGCGELSLVYYKSFWGRRIYERTLLFVFLLAMHRCFPGAKTRIDYAVGAGLFARVEKEPALTSRDAEIIKAEMEAIVSEDLPLVRRRLSLKEARAGFEALGRTDQLALLDWRPFPYFDVYGQGDYMDYFYGEMAPSTGYASVFDLIYHEGGLMLLRPDPDNPDRPAAFCHMPKLSATLQESSRWGELMHCGDVAQLNTMVKEGTVRELIRVNEALHEKKYAAVADQVVAKGARVVLIAGPSSSGKTTSANRLSTQLRVLGKTPVLLSLDDYYIDRDKVEREPDGSIDLEHIRTIDTALFSEHLAALLRGETVELPSFDFVIQRRVWKGHRLTIGPDTVLIIEGLHSLNPALLGDAVPPEQVFKFYVSALTTLNLDDHNRIPTTNLRLLRRMVRDYETRGASIEQTLSMWSSVRRGEERWIFPYQETADAMMNTTLVYEPAVLKKHIYPMLLAVPPENPWYDQVRAIVKFLNYFTEAEVEDEIPPTSILREFVGGNAFYRKG
ncbi:MAG: nucleoside kinase [Clostridia bacterium]|nr:nucleoside kinase [Clostridia bacterium]